jgi:hypothetical protein
MDVTSMSRSLHLPYKSTNPRSIRGAKKRGWHMVKVNNNYVERTSWVGLNIWCECSTSGYWIGSFHYREFAFESGADATAFQLKWG